ncbi:MAG: hypothetical protein JOZ41_04095 [Chloroflexi bacterium]|nr:hypothetical protein [Chloroflexota bacterium]
MGIETLGSSRLHALVRVGDNAARGRAIVLEPFASELGRGASAGDAQASALAQAGFHVDELKDSAVTVGVMETLGSYSVVYIETHSGVLPDGDADVVTGETNTRPYATLFNEKSLLQAFVAGDPSGTLYDAITAKFVRLHIGAFPASSVVFLNGCGVLAAPLFWDALHDQNVSTLISWDNDVDGDITDAAAQLLFTNLIQGGTVASAVTQVRAAGLGTSVVGTAVAHIGYIGDGGDTLQRALSGATPTPTPTPTPTDSPTPTVTPTATPVPKAAGKKKCKKGKRLVHGKCRPNKKAK